MPISLCNHLQKPDCIHRTSDQKEDHSSQIKLPHLHMQLNLSFHYLTPQHQSLCTCVSPNWWQREDIIKISLMTNFTARLGIQQLNSLVFCILRKPIYLPRLFLKGWVGWGWAVTTPSGERSLCHCWYLVKFYLWFHMFLCFILLLL